MKKPGPVPGLGGGAKCAKALPGIIVLYLKGWRYPYAKCRLFRSASGES